MAETVLEPFGSTRYPLQAAPEPGLRPELLAAQDGAPVPLAPALEQSMPEAAANAQTRLAREAAPESTFVEALGAGVKLWDSTRIVDRVMRPAFPVDPSFNTFNALQQLGIPLTEAQHEFMVSVGTSAEGFKYGVQYIQNLQAAQKVVGDHPIAGTIAALGDPIWMGIPPAVRLGRLAGAAGRATSAVASAAVTGGVMAAGEGPRDDAELALGMLTAGAVAAAVYTPGKGLVQADPDFPAAQLNTVVNDLRSPAPKPRYKLVSPAEHVDVEIPEVAAVFDDLVTPAKGAVYTSKTVGELPALAGAKPRFGYRDQQHVLEFANPFDKAAYILDGNGTSKAHAEIQKWATGSGVTLDALLARGKEIRGELKAAARDGMPVAVTSPSPFTYKPRVIRTLVSPAVPASTTRVLRTPAVPARVERRKVRDAVYELVPEELAPNAVRTEAAKVVEATEQALDQQAKALGVGHKIMWNMHKTLASAGPVGKRIADLLVDNNSDLSKVSVEAHKEMVHSDLVVHQRQYEDVLRAQMASEGAGEWAKVTKSREAYAVQQRIEAQVHAELQRREQSARIGASVGQEPPKHIKDMADSIDALHKRARIEMQAAGVQGAEALKDSPGYLTRKWSSLHMDQVMDRLEALGLDRRTARTKVDSLVALAVRRANPQMSKDVADSVGHAIVERAMNKGYHLDGGITSLSSNQTKAEIREILERRGTAEDVIQETLGVLTARTDEQGKVSFLKHRIDLDYRAQMRVGSETISVGDLIDGRVSTILDQYSRRVSTQVAMARNGIKSASDLDALRAELSHSITNPEKRAETIKLFDNIVAHMRGDPAGAAMNEHFRTVQAFTRATTLSWSGFWQATEYANAAAEYGLLKTVKYMAREAPGLRTLLKPTKEQARTLETALSEHSTASLRIRPFLARFEDGFEMDTANGLQLSMQAANNLVPMANGMAYVHHHQAKVVANLVLDRLEQAAKGNPKARQALAQYGLEAPVMDRLNAEIQKHGYAVDSWDREVWAAVRPAFGKMMDAGVLRSRLGDVPAFAAFDPVGKFLFTYRTFVLTAHNKVLAGGLERNGAAATGLVMLYQFPLAMLAVQAQAALRGETLDDEALVKKTVGQMGGLGLFSEPLKIIMGESNSVGAPGLIAIDRAARIPGAVSSWASEGDPSKAVSLGVSLFPVVHAIPFVNALAHRNKED